MANDIRKYCASHPVPTSHQKAGEKTAVKRNPMSAGWAWKPDEQTRRAIARGNRKKAKAQRESLNPETENSKMATKKAASKKKATRKTTRKTTARKKGTAKKVTKKATNNRIPLKRICADLDIDPKMARRKLRAAELSGHDPKSRWEFTPAQAKKAREVLSA